MCLCEGTYKRERENGDLSLNLRTGDIQLPGISTIGHLFYPIYKTSNKILYISYSELVVIMFILQIWRIVIYI
jgi:hypothetical protein